MAGLPDPEGCAIIIGRLVDGRWPAQVDLTCTTCVFHSIQYEVVRTGILRASAGGSPVETGKSRCHKVFESTTGSPLWLSRCNRSVPLQSSLWFGRATVELSAVRDAFSEAASDPVPAQSKDPTGVEPAHDKGMVGAP